LLFLLGLWLVLGLTLSVLAARARDWFDMTDELRYERLAISIARSHSLVPRIHGVDIHSFSQLYPLLLAPIFAHGLVPHDLRDAHVLNAWVISSSCIPAYLLAGRVTTREWPPLLAALLTVLAPWILYSTMLMTEVAAYPAFLWALLALHGTLTRPSKRADVLALLGLAVAFFARTELLVLVFVAPVAAIVFELGRGPARRAPGKVVRTHPVLTGAYAVLAVGGVVLWRAGRLADIFGVYGVYARTNQLLPPGFFGSFAQHLSTLSLGLGVLPVLAGGAWLVANVVRPPAFTERHAFACAAGVAVLGVLVQATNFDVRYTGYVHDRFLMYLAPLFVIAMLCWLEARPPAWTFAVPTVLLVAGFAAGSLPAFTWSEFTQLDPDSPISKIFEPLSKLAGGLTGARILLVAFTFGAALLLAFAGNRRFVRVVSVVFVVIAVPATTAFIFTRFFDTKDWAVRPISASEAGVFDWIDQTVGTHANVSMVPFPVDSDYFISQQRWRDLEFWNTSLDRDIHFGPDVFEYTGIWFPKLYLSVDPATGYLSASPTRWVAQSDKETRVGIAGPVRAESEDVLLIDAGARWRAAWMTFGLYDDGWTRPGIPTRIRVFPAKGQQHREIRYLTIEVRPPDDIGSTHVSLVSNVARWSGTVTDAATTSAGVRVCVPPTGFTQVRLTTPLDTAIPGDLDTLAASNAPRRGGVFLGSIALAGEIGGRCS